MSKQLLLMRQGKADNTLSTLLPSKTVKNSKRSQPLSERGKRAAQRMGVWIEANRLVPDEVLSSPYESATVTAEKTLKTMKRGIQFLRIHDDLQGDDLKALLKVVKNLPSAAQKVMLVGCGVGLDKLIRYFISPNEIKPGRSKKILKRSSLAVISLDGDWSELTEGDGVLDHLVFRSELPKLFPFPQQTDPSSVIEQRQRPEYYYTQSAVLPYRIKKNSVEFLLISSSKNRHWVIPKGIHEPGLSAQESAAKEAFEEAGIEGIVAAESLGSYSQVKWGAECTVEVFLMCVVRELDNKDWQESHRRRVWLSAGEARKKIKHQALVEFFKKAEQQLLTDVK